MWYTCAMKSIAMVAGLALAALTVAAEDYFWNNAEGGDWNVAANWKLGSTGTGGEAPGAPGESDIAYFCTGEYTISLNADTRVGKLTLENKDRNPACTVHFQLNGHALTTADTTLVDGDVSHGWATMTFTNGCVYSEKGMTVGQQNNASWRGLLLLDDVICAMTNALTVQGATPKLVVRNGSKVSCVSLGGYARKRADTMTIEGQGVSVTVNGAITACGPHNVRIADGAFVTSIGHLNINGYEQDFSGEPEGERGARVVIDNATVTNTGIKASIGLGNQNLRNCSLVLTNNARCVSYGFCYVGGRQNETFGGGHCLEVVDGSLLDLNGFESAGSRTCNGLRIANDAGSANNTLFVKDGTVKSRFVLIGHNDVTAGGACATNNVIHFAGTHPLVWAIAEHYQGYSTVLNSGSVLRFDISKDGYSNAPLKVDGTLKADRPTAEPYATLSNKIVVAARDFDRAQPETRLTLIETSKDSTAALQELVDNSTFLSGNPGTLTIENGGKRLVYTSPKRRGLVLLFR